MARPYAGDRGRALKEIFQAAQPLRKALSHVRDTHPNFSNIEVRVTTRRDGDGEDPRPTTPTTAACVFIIIGKTLDEAFKHAQDLEKQGCTCTSSGETEFTCDCPDD
jgi:alkanesulfonate monooxygenase SsuD/methylene tetrahydromethanopterin reductase-like flavin-dependent oxidoreductase (luciferase family)